MTDVEPTPAAALAAPTPEPAPADAAAAPAGRPVNAVGGAIVALFVALGGELAIAEAPPHVVTFAFVMVGWLLSVMVHEYSHALVAWRGGDHTIKAKGYLDFDPRRYGAWQTTLVIPILALALGGVGFPGGAVYLRNDLMRSPLWRSAAALAGPAATAALLILIAVNLGVWQSAGVEGGSALYAALSMLAFLQAMALVLNLLPIPGFDGFNAIRPFLPAALAPLIRRLQAFSTLALLALIFVVPGGGRFLFDAALQLSEAVGLRREAIASAWQAFHFWR